MSPLVQVLSKTAFALQVHASPPRNPRPPLLVSHSDLFFIPNASEPAVAYAASIESLLHALCARAPAKVDALTSKKRRVSHGLLSVGIKLHCLREDILFDRLIGAVGGKMKALDCNIYKRSAAKFCLVLPPVGNAHAATLLLECIEEYTGCRIFGNPDIQLQVCSPGRLNPRHAALHAIGFYLSSDTLRQYALEDFATTVSADYYYNCGKRLVLYDAGAHGEFDRAFAWWGRDAQGLAVRPSLPFHNGRTDILVGPGSKIDIYNINLLATLLIHAQFGGYWASLGELFASDLLSLLDRHLLAGLIEAPWICLSPGIKDNDHLFLSAVQELTAYAVAEAGRIKNAPELTSRGILVEMQELLGSYRAIVTSISQAEHGDAR